MKILVLKVPKFSMELDIPASVANVKSGVTKILEEEPEKIFNVKISIPPHGGKSMGIDTTRLYSQMKTEQQYGHAIKMKPMQSQFSRYYSDPNRKQRQQDVVVTAISEITGRRWRADIGKDMIIVLTVNKCPASILKKRKDDYLNDLIFLLKMVSSPVSIDV
jgi:hypothetical protein